MLIVLLGLVVYPIGRILSRMGFAPVLAVLAIIPGVNLIALWIVAFLPWSKSADGAGREMRAH